MFGSSLLSITLDGDSIRAVLTRGRRVVRWATLPLAAGVMADGIVIRPADVSKPVKALLESWHVKNPKTILGVTGARTVCRVLTIPKLPSSLIEKAVMHDAQGAIHVPIEELRLAWCRMGREGSGESVFLLGAPREIVESQVTALRAAGITSMSVDSRYLALSRAVNRPDAIIIDTEPQGIHLIVFTEGVGHVVRMVPTHLERSADVLARLEEEFDTTLRLYDEAYPDAPLPMSTEVVLTGSLAPASDTLKSVADRLQHPVTLASTPLKCPSDFPAVQYMATIGLALRGGGNRSRGRVSVPRLDLLPDSYRAKPKPFKELVFAPLVACAIVGLVFTYQASEDARARAAGAELDLQAIQQQVRQKQTESKKVADLEKTLIQMKADVSALEKDRSLLVADGGGYHVALNVVWAYAYGDVQLTSVDIKGGRMLIAGAALDHRAVIGYADRLATSRSFVKIDVMDSLTTVVGEGDQKASYGFKVDDRDIVLKSGDPVTLFTIVAVR